MNLLTSDQRTSQTLNRLFPAFYDTNTLVEFALQSLVMWIHVDLFICFHACVCALVFLSLHVVVCHFVLTVCCCVSTVEVYVT